MPHTQNFALPIFAESAHLRLDGISKSFASQRVLTNVSFTVAARDRLGLIGENGTGKSTLLRIVAGLELPDAGTVSITGFEHDSESLIPQVGLLHQEAPFSPHQSLGSAIEQAIVPARTAISKLDAAAHNLAHFPNDPNLLNRYAHALDRIERLDAWTIDTKVNTTLAGLGIEHIDRNRPISELSGGQRARLSLARLLLQSPRVLLLDEPTNHLDDAAAEFVCRTLSAWRGIVIFASHDRAFLDETATALVDLDPAADAHRGTIEDDDGSGPGFGVTRFTGSYSDYLQFRAAARHRWEQQFRDEQAELRRLRAATKDSQQVGHPDWQPRSETRMAKKFYADRNAKVVARRVNDARSRLIELEETQVRRPPHRLKFAGLTAASAPQARPAATNDPSHGPLLVVSDAAVAGRIAPISLALSPGEKLLLTGANGTGKSTLLALLSCSITPTSGTVWVQPGTSIGKLHQDVVLPDPMQRGPGRTVAQSYRDLAGPEIAAEVTLATFGLLSSQDANKPVAALSLGQQRRLELAIILASSPQILLLDEPTNHLALTLVTEFELALSHYPGTVIIASHDRWLRSRWQGQFLHLHGAG